MNIISFSEIEGLHISPSTCIEWARTAIKEKQVYKLPPKTSIKFNNSLSFFTSMPSMLPSRGVYGVKVVSRLPERIPSLKADILLYDIQSGELLALMDGTWITAYRTGAVASVTIDMLSQGRGVYSFIGLGNTARTTLICLDEIYSHADLQIYLYAYKNQHCAFMERFKDRPNIHFTVFENIHQMIQRSDVVISCVTATNDVLADFSDFKENVLVVPIHTRGFQNCDLLFDHIFCDDIGHISGFKYFKQYKSVTEMTDILNRSQPVPIGRKLAYNVGVSSQDIFFAERIYAILREKDSLLNKKFWV